MVHPPPRELSPACPSKINEEYRRSSRVGRRLQGLMSLATSVVIHIVVLLVLACVLLRIGAQIPSLQFEVSVGDTDEEISLLPAIAVLDDDSSNELFVSTTLAKSNETGNAILEATESIGRVLVSERDHNGQAGVTFFGARGYGNDFVFVMDVSGSMGERNGGRLKRAQDELIKSIRQLQPENRFYLIVFNSGARQMFGNKGKAKLITATLENKSRVIGWIRKLKPGGGTNPTAALELAGSLGPDAVFFLSDGAFDYEASNEELEKAKALRLKRLQKLQARMRDGRLKPNEKVLDSIKDLMQVKTAGVPKNVLASYARHIVVHTVAFEDTANCDTMETIADNAGGQYRFVPPAKKD